MKIANVIFLLFVTGILFASFIHISEQQMIKKKFMVARLQNIHDFIDLLPRNKQDIEERTALYQEALEQEVKKLLAIDSQGRTFANTVMTLDRISGISDLAVWHSILHLYEQVHPAETIRQACADAIKQITCFFVDTIGSNKKVYEALRDFEQIKNLPDIESKLHEYVLKEFLDDYKRAGMQLPDQEIAQICKLQKEICDLGQAFDRNISTHNSRLLVSKDQLKGLPEEFIGTLEKQDDGQVWLGLDYPTYFKVMAECLVEKTRHDLQVLFEQRGYPANDSVLKELVSKRHQLATLLGFENFTAYDLADQMVGTPERAREFLEDLVSKSSVKEQRELAQWCDQLPPSVTLLPDGKVKNWDLELLKNEYKKRSFAIDESAIQEYFPLDQTISKLFTIYEKFMSLSFEEVAIENVWHEDVRALAVYNTNKTKLYGYIFLDLHPRPNKYSHAALFTLVPGVYFSELGDRVPAFGAVVANFPRGCGDKPSFLRRDDVKTFFHEFGHALHLVLSDGAFATLAGTRVKRDFVELPSQMLEEWLTDADILRFVSCHYKTNEPLPADIVDNIVKLKQYDSGFFVTRQATFAFFALDLFSTMNPDLDALFKSICNKYRSYIYRDPKAYFYTNFGHLYGYGAKYYGYLWSKVFALDLADYIKNHGGFLDPAIGTRYVKSVLAKGGTEDPNELLEDFLGRKPNQKAFFADLGL